jgi:hypothetical protein
MIRRSTRLYDEGHEPETGLQIPQVPFKDWESSSQKSPKNAAGGQAGSGTAKQSLEVASGSLRPEVSASELTTTTSKDCQNDTWFGLSRLLKKQSEGVSGSARRNGVSAADLNHR